MQLILVRHGETASNRDRLALGRNDIPLNELGLRQAESVAASLAAEGRRGLPIEAVYSSPLVRAHQTAEAVAARLGVPVIDEPGLIEMDVGEMDGLTGAQLRERYPEFMAAWFGPQAGEARMPGGESLSQVQGRAWEAVERLRGKHSADSAIVAVSHNFVIRTIVCRALSVPLAEFRRFEQDLASFTRIDFRGARLLLTALNDTCHLHGLQIETSSW